MKRLVWAVVLLSGCAVIEPPPPPVPPARAERIPAPPASRITLIWEPGHWDWAGDHYLWQTGRWVPRSGHGPLWQDGSWQRGRGAWVWSPAHWL